MGHLEACRVSWPGPLIVAPASTAENTDIQAVECCLSLSLSLFSCVWGTQNSAPMENFCMLLLHAGSEHPQSCKAIRDVTLRTLGMADHAAAECENWMCSLPSLFFASMLTHAYAASACSSTTGQITCCTVAANQRILVEAQPAPSVPAHSREIWHSLVASVPCLQK